MILFLGFWLGTIVLLPALLKVLQADVTYALVCALRVTEVVNWGFYGKEQRSSTGT
jgi:hypothetical protein